jgi:hypothetical protein
MLRLESIVRDVRHACRSLARRPSFAAVAVITLAVGIGTMTVAFSAVNAFFLAGPPIDAEGTGIMTVTDGKRTVCRAQRSILASGIVSGVPDRSDGLAQWSRRPYRWCAAFRLPCRLL